MIIKFLYIIISKIIKYDIISCFLKYYPKINNKLYLQYYKIKIDKFKQKVTLNDSFDFTNISKNLIDFIFLGKGIIYTQQVKSELIRLLKILKTTKPKYILEIGTAGGGTLFLISKVAKKDAVIISVDLPGGIHGGGYPKWKSSLYRFSISSHQKLYLIRANSHDINTLRKIEAILGGNKIDFLFIDGDHTYSGVKNDFNLYKKLVKSKGIIAFHDIAKHPSKMNCHVNNLWNEIKHNYDYLEIIQDRGQNWAGIGVIYNN